MVGTLELPCAVIAATMTSLAAVAAGRRDTAAGVPAGCVHVALVPLHTSVVHRLPSSVHGVPLAWKASLGQVVLVPVQLSATSHSPAAARHTAPGFPAGCVHVALVPLHTSLVQTLPSSVQVVPLASKMSVGQAVLEPSQVSASSHSPAAARHAAPAFPAGCVQAGAPAVPSHTSVVQGLPSSLLAVPAALTVSAGHVALEPVQLSATSHSFAAARQTVVLGWKRHEAEQHEPAVPFDGP